MCCRLVKDHTQSNGGTIVWIFKGLKECGKERLQCRAEKEVPPPPSTTIHHQPSSPLKPHGYRLPTPSTVARATNRLHMHVTGNLDQPSTLSRAPLLEDSLSPTSYPRQAFLPENPGLLLAAGQNRERASPPSTPSPHRSRVLQFSLLGPLVFPCTPPEIGVHKLRYEKVSDTSSSVPGNPRPTLDSLPLTLHPPARQPAGKRVPTNLSTFYSETSRLDKQHDS